MKSLYRSVDIADHRRGERGSALMMVVYFASIMAISVFSYLLYQMSVSKPSLRSPSSLQALFNARSGAYKALYYLIDSTTTDTLKTISTLDSSFGGTMFNGLTDSADTESVKPDFDGTPVVYQLFEGDSLGDCEVSLEPAGGICLLKSTGSYRSVKRSVVATLGSRTPALPDTVIIHHNRLPWEGSPPIGTVVADTVDSVHYNSSAFNSIIDKYLTDITDVDSFLLNPPLVIQSNYDLGKIDSVVNGPLLLDGAHIGLTWRDTSTIIVKGDLQVTGEVRIEGVKFIVAGEIKLLDKSILTGSNIFSSSRIFIGDFAQFEGNALALKSIAVYGKAVITGRSSLIAGSSRSSPSATAASDSLKFSILLSEECSVDAVCIALETPGSIKTDHQARITGILWAKNLVCHRGRMSGLICAQRVVDCDNPEQMATNPTAPDTSRKNRAADPLVPTQFNNSMTGELEPLQEISLYHLPYFIGRLSIVAWKEE